MVALPITALYAGLLALLLVALSFRVIALRRAQRISLGGGDARLEQRIRSQANFCEYVPLALLLLGLLEAGDLAPWVLHGLGMALLVGRLAHPWGIEGAGMVFRQVGTLLTFGVLILAAVALLALAMRAL